MKRLTSSQKQIRATCQSRMLIEALSLRKQGYDYPHIEELLFQKGIVDHNGKRFRNAKICYDVIKSDPSLRVNKPKNKTIKKQNTKKTIKSNVSSLKLSLNALPSALKEKFITSPQDVISKLQYLSIPNDLILEVIKKAKFL